jgi:glycosyltransferase involved in cell wall biosynthesis
MNALVTNSEYGTRYYRDRLCPGDRIRVIRLGVQAPQNQTHGWLRSELGLQDSVRLLVTTVSLIHRKGLDVLLQAVSAPFKEHRDWHLLIVGGGPLLETLKEQACQLGIEQQTHFLGRINNVVEVLGDCNAFVLPSRNEDFPCAILEAMASSLPVVATDVGSVREMVLNNKTGFLVPPEDAEGLRSAIQAILLDDRLAHGLGCGGRERVEKMFSFDTMVDGYLNLCRDLCK